MALNRVPTEMDIRNEVADLILIYAEPDYQKKLESKILSKGRTEMQYLLAFLLKGYLEKGLEINKLNNKIDELQSYIEMLESEPPRPMED